MGVVPRVRRWSKALRYAIPGTGKSLFAEAPVSKAIVPRMRVAWFEPEALFEADDLG